MAALTRLCATALPGLRAACRVSSGLPSYHSAIPRSLRWSTPRRRLATNASAATAGPGDKVWVHYTGKLDSGETFDSSVGRDPLEFVVGSGMVIKGFDTLVTGLAVGGKRSSRIPPEDAYGERSDKLVARVTKDRAPEGLEVGMMVELANGMYARVTDVTEEEVEIDANQRLAGQALNFEVELVQLEKGPEGAL